MGLGAIGGVLVDIDDVDLVPCFGDYLNPQDPALAGFLSGVVFLGPVSLLRFREVEIIELN